MAAGTGEVGFGLAFAVDEPGAVLEAGPRTGDIITARGDGSIWLHRRLHITQLELGAALQAGEVVAVGDDAAHIAFRERYADQPEAQSPAPITARSPKLPSGRRRSGQKRGRRTRRPIVRGPLALVR